MIVFLIIVVILLLIFILVRKIKRDREYEEVTEEYNELRINYGQNFDTKEKLLFQIANDIRAIKIIMLIPIIIGCIFAGIIIANILLGLPHLISNL